jgi:hypothetical protein
MLRLPKPDKIERPDRGGDEPSVESIAKSHLETLNGPAKLASDSD